ncbi:MAG TPA: hypothetical protein VED18_02355 [Candidatus Sulfotelmatobacter sp.]|nr:hypothetical protein [Candidatus Sulfotelmatobacter sp.]
MYRGCTGLLPTTAVLVLLATTPCPAQQTDQRIILSLGSDQFVPKAAIEGATGARIQSDFRGLRFLDEVSVIVLADIANGQLPAFLQSSLPEWVGMGGSLLVTGGNSAFGLGGYAGTPIGELLPLRPFERDRTGHGFSPTYIVAPAHPVMAGVTTSTMADFNETSLAGDATLLLEYRGVSKGGASAAGMTGSGKGFSDPGIPGSSAGAGVPGGIGMGGIPNNVIGTINTEGGIQGGGRGIFPLIAERRQGGGTVLAIALDMNATGQWPDRSALILNAVRYLLDQSKLPKR